MSTTHAAAELAERERALSDEVIARFDRTADARTRGLLQSLVRHLHAFAREERLAEAEWQEEPPGDGPGGRALETPWWRIHFDLKLARTQGVAA
jgi:catechol 2,3-dioxygenase-like protein